MTKSTKKLMPWLLVGGGVATLMWWQKKNHEKKVQEFSKKSSAGLLPDTFFKKSVSEVVAPAVTSAFVSIPSYAEMTNSDSWSQKLSGLLTHEGHNPNNKTPEQAMKVVIFRLMGNRDYDESAEKALLLRSLQNAGFLL